VLDSVDGGIFGDSPVSRSSISRLKKMTGRGQASVRWFMVAAISLP
jgi:hypothetical protein